MNEFLHLKTVRPLKKLASCFILISFISSLIVAPAGAQILPLPGTSVGLTPGFQPTLLVGLKIHPENPLLFDFIVDQGSDKFSPEELKAETEKLVKYFLAALTIPDKEVWVNLSPYEKDRIIPDALGQTIMGKTMLEQDYLLKQLASSLTNPEEKLGQEFWTKVRTQAGNENVEASTLSKVWIVPQKAEVLENNGIVLVSEKHLKIMMADEYQSLNDSTRGAQAKTNKSGNLSSAVFRATILPNIEKEINEGKNFAGVRQIYNSVILAAWYKKALKESLLGRIYTDKSKVAGVETDDKEMKQRIYEQYLSAFKKGVYNVIKEETDSASGDVVARKYFSGGVVFSASSTLKEDHIADAAMKDNLANATGRYVFYVQGTESGTPNSQVVQDGVAASSAVRAVSFDRNYEYTQEYLVSAVTGATGFAAVDLQHISKPSLQKIYAAIDDHPRKVAASLEGVRNGQILLRYIEVGKDNSELTQVIGFQIPVPGSRSKPSLMPVVYVQGRIAPETLEYDRGVEQIRNLPNQVQIESFAGSSAMSTFVAPTEPIAVDWRQFANNNDAHPPNEHDAKSVNDLLRKWPAFQMIQVDPKNPLGYAELLGSRDAFLFSELARAKASFNNVSAVLSKLDPNSARIGAVSGEAIVNFLIFKNVMPRNSAMENTPNADAASSSVSFEKFPATDEQVANAAQAILDKIDTKAQADPQTGSVKKTRPDKVHLAIGIIKDEVLTTSPDAIRKVIEAQIQTVGGFENGTIKDRLNIILVKLKLALDLTAEQLERQKNSAANEVGKLEMYYHDYDEMVKRFYENLRLRRLLMIFTAQEARFIAVMVLAANQRGEEIRSLLAWPSTDFPRLSVADAKRFLDILGREDSQEEAKEIIKDANGYHLFFDPGGAAQTIKRDEAQAALNALAAESSSSAVQGVVTPTTGEGKVKNPSLESAASSLNDIKNPAAVSPVIAAPGGIDFDPTNMNLQIKRNGKGVPLPLPQQNLEQINIQGIVPVIINYMPINAQTLPIFLGQAPKDPARDPEALASTRGG